MLVEHADHVQHGLVDEPERSLPVEVPGVCQHGPHRACFELLPQVGHEGARPQWRVYPSTAAKDGTQFAA
jgi:hypothetical protein